VEERVKSDMVAASSEEMVVNVRVDVCLRVVVDTTLNDVGVLLVV
jgi:hypothetical protein